jgi:hypothetical protein
MAAVPAILDLVSIDFPTKAWVDWSDFLVALWGNWRKVPFDDQRCRSSNMATTAAISDLVSVDYLTNACVDWSNFFRGPLGVITLHHVPLLPKPYLPYTHRQLPTRGHMPCLALPLFVPLMQTAKGKWHIVS